MDQATYEIRCPQRYRNNRPAHFTAAPECADFHDHRTIGSAERPAAVCVVTDSAKHFAAADEWREHLRAIAALPVLERGEAIRADRLHDVDIKTVERFVEQIGREVRVARWMLLAHNLD